MPDLIEDISTKLLGQGSSTNGKWETTWKAEENQKPYSKGLHLSWRASGSAASALSLQKAWKNHARAENAERIVRVAVSWLEMLPATVVPLWWNLPEQVALQSCFGSRASSCIIISMQKCLAGCVSSVYLPYSLSLELQFYVLFQE